MMQGIDISGMEVSKDELALSHYSLISARAARFERRLKGEREPTFADLVREQKAAHSSDRHGERLAVTIALLQAKPALDRELSGKRLQEISQTVGEELLDAVIRLDMNELPKDSLVPVLPPLAALIKKGTQLLSRVADDAQISQLVQCAGELMQSAGPVSASKAHPL